MSGHSKWSTIKHKKAATDKKRAKIFTRLAKEVTLAARDGGGDLDFNPALRLAVDKAKAANMPKDNIERAIKRGTGELEGDALVEVLYEGYGPHGVGLIIETVTDNKNRTVAAIRSTLNKGGGSMATNGAVSWQFKRKGYIEVKPPYDNDELFLIAADAGADDIEYGEDVASVYSDPAALSDIRDALQENGFTITELSLIYDPDNPLSLSVKQTMQIMSLVEQLDDLDDVQNVYSALDLSEEVMAELAAQ